MKTSRQLERHFKGVANYSRLEILLLISKQKEISLENIAAILNRNVKTISEHTRRLVAAGLVNKKYKGREVIHTTSPYGEKLITFIKTFN